MPHEINGEMIVQDERGIVVKHDGYEKVIPWTAIAMVTNTAAMPNVEDTVH